MKDWSNRTVNNKLTVEKYTVNDIIVSYLEDQFFVNRKYQRKLVWGLKEKQLLIDSMIRKIPLPAILLVKYDVPQENKSDVLEIVDGMQRLNAIISFVMGEFGVEYDGKICYFDPESYSETFNLLRNDDKRLKRNTTFLPEKICIDFYRYDIAAIVTGNDDATVELIFSRVNSTGKKISNQDLRQSKAIGEFPDLVRRISSDIRMDNTFYDHVPLSEMPQISVGPKKYGYGVDIDKVFWRRHDIIRAEDIKESKDEEIIETLLATVLLDNFRKSKDNLDDLYKEGTKLNTTVEEQIALNGKNDLEDRFKKVFDTFDMIFDSVDSNFSSYLFDQKRTKNKDECFKLIFLAVYRLISEGYIIVNYDDVAESLRNSKILFDSIVATNKVNYDKLNSFVDNLYKLIKPSFSKEILYHDNEMTKEIDNRLSYSSIESQMTEFKIGISDFSSKKVNMNVIHDIAQNLVAMSNTTARDEEGLIILGIADTRDSYKTWHDVFKDQAIIVNQHYIPGVTKEAEKLCGKTDNYFRELRKLIAKEPISEKLKEYVLETFSPLDYHGTELIIFKTKYMGETSLYNGDKYVRQSNEKINVSKMKAKQDNGSIDKLGAF